MKAYRIITFLIPLVLFCAPVSEAASSTVYKCQNPDGRVEFTDQPCPQNSSSSTLGNNKSTNSTQQKLPKIESQGSARVKLDELPVRDRLISCNQKVAIAAAEEMVRDPAIINEPLELFGPATALFQNGKKDEGVFWFYAGQLRVRQQIVVDNGDRGQLLSVMLMTVGVPINNYAFQDTSNLNKILDRVLEWDKKTENPFRVEAEQKNLGEKIDQIYDGYQALKVKLITEKSTLETAARSAESRIEQTYSKMNRERCHEGQSDPAYDRLTMKEEEKLAMDYVLNNEQLIKLTKGKIETYPAASIVYPDNKNKGRYEFTLVGPTNYFAIVDVNRGSGKPVFNLSCVTLTSQSAGKDSCSQSTIALPK